MSKKCYLVTIEESQEDKILSTRTDILYSKTKPRIGDGYAKLCSPPIYVKIVNIIEVKK